MAQRMLYESGQDGRSVLGMLAVQVERDPKTGATVIRSVSPVPGGASGGGVAMEKAVFDDGRMSVHAVGGSGDQPSAEELGQILSVVDGVGMQVLLDEVTVTPPRAEAFRGTAEARAETWAEVVKGTKETRAEVVKGTKETRAEVVKGTKETRAEVVKGTKETRAEVVKGTKETRAEVVKGTKETGAEVVKGTKETRAEVVKGTKETRAETRAEAFRGTKETRAETRAETIRAETSREMDAAHVEAFRGTDEARAETWAEVVKGTKEARAETRAETSRGMDAAHVETIRVKDEAHAETQVSSCYLHTVLSRVGGASPRSGARGLGPDRGMPGHAVEIRGGEEDDSGVAVAREFGRRVEDGGAEYRMEDGPVTLTFLGYADAEVGGPGQAVSVGREHQGGMLTVERVIITDDGEELPLGPVAPPGGGRGDGVGLEPSRRDLEEIVDRIVEEGEGEDNSDTTAGVGGGARKGPSQERVFQDVRLDEDGPWARAQGERADDRAASPSRAEGETAPKRKTCQCCSVM